MSLESNSVKPIVIVEPKLSETSSPYTVSIDEEGIGNLLGSMGFNEEQIQHQRIFIKRRHRVDHVMNLIGLEHGGTYNRFTGAITVFTEPAWKTYRFTMQEAERISKGDSDILSNWVLNKVQRKVLHTKRLVLYLNQYPPEHTLPVVSRLVLSGLNRYTSSILAHEANHARKGFLADQSTVIWASSGITVGTITPLAIESFFHPNIPVMPITIASMLVCSAIGYGIGYKRDPDEKDGNLAMAETMKDLRYRSLISIHPNIDNPFPSFNP